MPRTGRRNPLDLTPRRPIAGQRGFALRQRDRGREARAPDQLLLPQPGRGHVRGVPAAHGGHRFQELPDHRPRGGRGRQGQVPLPRLSAADRPGKMARLLLGVTGGIAAYKAIELARLAIKAGHAVRVIQTEASTRFAGIASFAGITGAPVLVTEWEPDPLRGAFPGEPQPAHAPLSHLELVERADAFLIAPASANTIAKLAGGHADNLLTAAALACRRPLIVAPAMNAAMYEHPATQANLARLRERGAIVLDPGTGSLASLGEEGIGRLPEPHELLAAIERALGHSRALDGLKVLVTAGGTREPIDAVRFVGNRSSGRMGFALAEAAAARGATVTVIAANVALPRRAGIDYIDVTTAAELAEAAERSFARADVLLMAAAVADYRPAEPHEGKLKKEAAGELKLQPVRTTDVLSALADAPRPGP